MEIHRRSSAANWTAINFGEARANFAPSDKPIEDQELLILLIVDTESRDIRFNRKTVRARPVARRERLFSENCFFVISYSIALRDFREKLIARVSENTLYFVIDIINAIDERVLRAHGNRTPRFPIWLKERKKILKSPRELVIGS